MKRVVCASMPTGTNGIEVHAAHLHVLDAALAQRVQRALAAADHALGPDRAVELVLDLQQAGRELVVLAAEVAHADRLVRRIGSRQPILQRRGVALEAVVAHGERRLRIALVAQPPHAQRGRVRQVQRTAGDGLQAVIAPGDEARADGRRGAEQVQQQERVAAEVADQREVLLGRDARHRPVVVDARDRLHAPPVAVPEPHAVDALGAADVGRAVDAERDRLVGRQPAGHRADPQHLVAEGAIDELVDLRQLRQAGLGVRVHAGDQLELRLAEIGRDVRVRQRRTERRRMRRQRERAARLRAQAFLLDAAPDAQQGVGREPAQAVLQYRHALVPFRVRANGTRRRVTSQAAGRGADRANRAFGSEPVKKWITPARPTQALQAAHPQACGCPLAGVRPRAGAPARPAQASGVRSETPNSARRRSQGEAR